MKHGKSFCLISLKCSLCINNPVDELCTQHEFPHMQLRGDLIQTYRIVRGRECTLHFDEFFELAGTDRLRNHHFKQQRKLAHSDVRRNAFSHRVIGAWNGLPDAMMALADVEVFEDAVPLVRCCPALNEIRTSGELKDLSIEVKHGVTLNAHRIILAARIPSLRAALSGALGKDNSVLKWPTVPPNLANSLIKYVYTGQLEVTQTNAMAVVMFAKMMKLSNLENWGVQFMANRVNLENLATTWDFAKSMRMGSLMKTCINLMQEQFRSLVYTDLFLRLPADTVLTLLRNDHLPVDSEEAVFEAISSWVRAGDKECDNERLRLHAPEMLKEVRWCQTTLQFRSRLVGSHPMFRDNNSCGRFMTQVEQWMSYADKDKPPCPFNRRRRPPQTIFFVFGEDKDQDRWSVLRFDPHLEKEERIADMEKREFATYSLVGESIFAVGGDTAQQLRSTSVEEFLVAERRWRKRASLAVGRYGHAAAVLTEAGGEALIGVFGGWGNGRWLSSCEVYEVRRDRWFKLPDLREKRSDMAAACLPGDSRVFVFGGANDPFSPLASVEFCQLRADWRERATSSDFWQPAAPMRTARAALAATHFRGKIIVAGGGNVVEMFTPPDARCPRGQWTELAGMKEHRWYFALLTSNDDAVFALAPSEDQHQPRPPTLSLHETIRTVQQLSSGKAPASDASSAEVYKHDGPKFMEHLMAFFQGMWRQGEVPQDFKGATIIYLFKRIGNHQLCGNHQGICLLNIAGKIFAHILLNRLHNYLDQSVLAKSQCGFRRYRGTKHRIFAARQLQKKRQEMRTHLQFTFMDPPTKGTAPLLSADGSTLLTETTQILQRWAEHIPGVLNRPSAISDAAIDRLPQVETNADLDLPPSLQETIRAVQ
ncbi:hypothetical protein SprV_1002818300 [Sparganum proliferum]